MSTEPVKPPTEKRCGDPWHDDISVSSKVYDQCPTCRGDRFADEARDEKEWSQEEADKLPDVYP